MVSREIDTDGARNFAHYGTKVCANSMKICSYNIPTRFTHCADENQPARNSCPRLDFLILGLVSIMSLSLRSALQLFELLIYNLPPLPDLTGEVLVLRIFIFFLLFKG